MPISFFAQIIKLIPRGAFDKIVIEEKADKYSKRLLSWDQLIAMLWCQFSGAESLRDIARGLYSGVGKLQHIQAQPMSRSSLAYANANRTYRIFERLYYELKDLLFKGDLGRLAKEFDRTVLSLDSTTISLCLSVYNWAHYRKAKGGIKLHTLLNNDTLLPEFMCMTNAKVNDDRAAKEKVLRHVPAHSILIMDRGYCDFDLFRDLDAKGVIFVTRMKTNQKFSRTGDGKIGNNYGDYGITFTSQTAVKKLGEDNRFRAVKWYSAEDDKWFVFVTNAKTDIDAEQVARLYKDRWQIELFFKKMKQNLRILSFVGTSENAVLVQIWTATICVLLQMYLQKRSAYPWNFSGLVQCIRLNLMTMKDLEEWLIKPDVCIYPGEGPSGQEESNQRLLFE